MEKHRATVVAFLKGSTRLSGAALIPQQLHVRHVSTPTGHAGNMEPEGPAIAYAAEGGMEAAPSLAAAVADLNSPADTTGQMQI